ncbi:MAG: hypothetical protein M1818_001975 [Claussenomyces sp. TS43310]|nr:MAG: hypothetical protein M1818_001975 [Claussenomyces sp. TS43310]
MVKVNKQVLLGQISEVLAAVFDELEIAIILANVLIDSVRKGYQTTVALVYAGTHTLWSMTETRFNTSSAGKLDYIISVIPVYLPQPTVGVVCKPLTRPGPTSAAIFYDKSWQKSCNDIWQVNLTSYRQLLGFGWSKRRDCNNPCWQSLVVSRNKLANDLRIILDVSVPPDFMKQEAKSIFTSQKSFGAQYEQQVQGPRIAIVPKHSTTLSSSEAKEIGVARKQQINPATEKQKWAGPVAEDIGKTPLDAPPCQERQQQQDTWSGPTTVRKARAEKVDSRHQSPPSTLPQPPTLKRPHDQHTSTSCTSEPPCKRPRHRLKPRYTLDSATFPTGFSTDTTSPVSPLFFSHTPRRRPALLASFSSSEAAATMLSKARDEGGGITTLKLARGSVSNASPPRAMSTPGSLKSLGRSSITPQTPDSRNSSLQVLGSVGIVDLLEQDERPTFIIDLANTSNFSPGPLQILFANASLRGHEAILGMVMGNVDPEFPGVTNTNTFPEFKAWALSFVKNNESLDVSLPSFIYGGVTWICSTLKRRLRVIGGYGSSLPSKGLRSGSTSMSYDILAQESVTLGDKLPAHIQEPPDYFGSAVPYPQNTSEDATSSSALVAESAELGRTASSLDSGAIPNLRSSQSPAATRTDTSTSLVATPIQGRLQRQLSTPRSELSSFDWTRLPMSSALPRHIKFARNIDWASTELGPIESWDFDLRAMCNLVMGSPHPAAMYWGDEYIAIYNEAYVLLAGQKHPQLMGQSYKKAWAEIWDDIEEVFVNAKESGQATMKDDDCLFIMRNGFLEESYFSWSIVPLVGEDGSVVGLYNPAFEKTRRKIAERRMLTLREVGERSAAAREVRAFWGQVIDSLESNEYDVPFVFLYSVTDDADSDMSSIHSGSLPVTPSQCILEGTLGVPEEHPSAASPLDLKSSNDAWAPYLREAMKTDKPVLLTTDDGILSSLIAGLSFRGFGDPCRAAVICPIHPTTGEAILGFLVMGINPRRPYDDDYSLFIQLLSRQIATSMASVVLFEEEIRRGQRAARLAAEDRIELSKQLDLRTQEVAESETKFTRMAEFAPVGMFIADAQGKITFSNGAWWVITGHTKEINNVDTWMDSVMDDDRAAVESMWRQVVIEKIQISAEFRVKAPWQDPNGVSTETWVLMNAYPEKDVLGRLKSVFGCLTNISQQKYAEEFQKRRMEEAVELKRQQENFIDITSHEMRNPLSAILQCADEICLTLSDCRSGDLVSTVARRQGPRQNLDEKLDSSIDAAQTITLCAQHQKRIVDDILTLSKLDSALLLVTPVDVQPVSVVQRALKMFESELDTNDIRLAFQVEQAYVDLEIDWVKLDPSRLLQVLINLTTNAIKFTHTEAKRTILVSIGASKERPSSTIGDQTGLANAAALAKVSYFPSRSKSSDMTTGDDWGTGEEVYLHFAVQDTGRGLDRDEKMLLFRRFSQASPRTHVQYGGSGLGLFISRELTELQGGEIGVASERGIGSTFAFYVKARRAVPPAHASTPPPIATRKNSTERHLPRIIQPFQQDRSERTGQTSSMGGRGLKVLVVEDNLVNQRVLQKQLRNLGCTTHLANHGEEALDILRRSRFWAGKELDGIELTVILMDLEMPVMDGLTCARRIRELEAKGTVVKHVPIIAVTANARLEQIQTALEVGMDDVVSKPFRIPELIAKIKELVGKQGDDPQRSET